MERDIVSLYMKAIHFAESVVGSVPAGSNHYVNVSWIIGASHQQLGSLFHKVAFDPAVRKQRNCLVIIYCVASFQLKDSERPEPNQKDIIQNQLTVLQYMYVSTPVFNTFLAPPPRPLLGK